MSLAQVKEVFQAGSQELQHHGVVLPTWTKVINLRDPHCMEEGEGYWVWGGCKGEGEVGEDVKGRERWGKMLRGGRGGRGC